MKKRNLKEKSIGKIQLSSSGITLIALVVTIIVLMILAGVAVAALMGDNGIIKRAGEARTKIGIQSLEEEAQMILSARNVNKSIGLENRPLKDDLLEQKSPSTEIEEIKIAGSEETYTDVYYMYKGNDYITVYEDGEIQEGKVEIWDGTTSECPEFKKENNIWHWYIYTPAQLKFLADFVNNGNTLTSEQETEVTTAGYNKSDITMVENQTTVYLMNNLDLGARAGAGSTEEQKWETELNETKRWSPIGLRGSTPLKGTFEGNGNTIKGVYVNQTEGQAGLFGVSNAILNLTIANSYIKGISNTGSVVGAVLSGNLENCHNLNTIVVLREGDFMTVGGLAGQVRGSTINCTNKGTIYGYGKYGSNGDICCGRSCRTRTQY